MSARVCETTGHAWSGSVCSMCGAIPSGRTGEPCALCGERDCEEHLEQMLDHGVKLGPSYAARNVSLGVASTTKQEPAFACCECGRKFRTTASARKAMSGKGCPKCGSVDIDIAPIEAKS